jgi:hypothetical protein
LRKKIKRVVQLNLNHGTMHRKLRNFIKSFGVVFIFKKNYYYWDCNKALVESIGERGPSIVMLLDFEWRRLCCTAVHFTAFLFTIVLMVNLDMFGHFLVSSPYF